MRRLVAALSVSGTMYCRCAACGYAGCAWPAPLSAAVEQKRSTPNHGVGALWRYSASLVEAAGVEPKLIPRCFSIICSLVNSYVQ